MMFKKYLEENSFHQLHSRLVNHQKEHDKLHSEIEKMEDQGVTVPLEKLNRRKELNQRIQGIQAILTK